MIGNIRNSNSTTVYRRRSLHFTLLLIVGLMLIGCSSADRIAELQQERDDLRAQLVEANSQIVILREKNASLEADLKGGRTAEEESKALDVREAGLNQLAQELVIKKGDLDEREIALRLRETDVEQKLDVARKESISLANRWLIAFASLVVLIPLLLVGIFLWVRTRNVSNQDNVSVHSLSPQQAYMLESVYHSLEDSSLKRRAAVDSPEIK